MVFVMGLISLMVTAGLLVAFGRRNSALVVRDPLADALAEYERRLADTDKDVARGTLTNAEAELAKAEIARHLLAQKKALEKSDGQAVGSVAAGERGGPASGIFDGAVLALIAALPLFAGALYWQLGSPGFADQPLAQRSTPQRTQALPKTNNTPAIAPTDQTAQLQAFVTALETRLQKEPGDIDGWALLARSQDALGDAEQAAQAWRTLLTHDEDNRDALWFLGVNAVARGNIAEARESWLALRTQYDPGTQDYDLINQALATLETPPTAKPEDTP